MTYKQILITLAVIGLTWGFLMGISGIRGLDAVIFIVGATVGVGLLLTAGSLNCRSKKQMFEGTNDN